MTNKLNNKSNLQNKVVLVTGGARRIGAVIARYFHQLNYQVIIHYRNSATAAIKFKDELNNLRPGSAVALQADLGNLVNPDLASKFVDSVIDAFGRLDVLVNNASSFFATPLGQVNLNQWRDLLISNTGAPFFLAQALVPHLKQTQGSIINISDIHAVRPLKNHSVYNIAKAGNDMVTKTLARELAPDITVNGVAPGPAIWPENGDLDDELKQKVLNKTLLGKLNDPLSIAKTVMFLAENKDITGQIIAVDGGRSLKD